MHTRHHDVAVLDADGIDHLGGRHGIDRRGVLVLPALQRRRHARVLTGALPVGAREVHTVHYRDSRRTGRLHEDADVVKSAGRPLGQLRQHRQIADDASLALRGDDGGVAGVDESGEVDGHRGIVGARLH